MDDVARSNYEPSNRMAKRLTRYREAVELLADKDALRELAAEEMRDHGATVGDMARWTGLSTELFRRIARAEGIERRRPPTVRRIAEDRPPES